MAPANVVYQSIVIALIFVTSPDGAPVEQAIEVSVGENVTLPCFPRVTPVDWRFKKGGPGGSGAVKRICQGGVILNGNVKRFFHIGRNENDYSLLLVYAQTSDSGLYTCIEDSGVGTTYNIRLKVYEDVYGYPGQPAILPCHTDHPTPVDWRFRSRQHETKRICQGGDILNGNGAFYAMNSTTIGDSSLIVKVVELELAGHYTCIEDSGTGLAHYVRLHLITSGNALPMHRNQTAYTGDTVVLSCQSNSGHVTWRYSEASGGDVVLLSLNGSVVPRHRERVSFEKRSNGDSRLHIYNVRVYDSGIYTCMEESLSTPRIVIQLTLLESKVTSFDYTSVVGQDVVFACKASLDSVVDWTFRSDSTGLTRRIVSDGEITDKRSWRYELHRNVHEQDQSLEIQDLQLGDSGQYTCVARETPGQRTTVHLRVLGNSQERTNLTPTELPNVVPDDYHKTYVFTALAVAVPVCLCVVVVTMLCKLLHKDHARSCCRRRSNKKKKISNIQVVAVSNGGRTDEDPELTGHQGNESSSQGISDSDSDDNTSEASSSPLRGRKKYLAQEDVDVNADLRRN